jgi:hypothetical protein
MNRAIICAAIAAATITMAMPAQAMPANPGLNASAPTNIEQARYYHRHWRSHRRGWNSYAYSPYGHRDCWTVRVRTWGNHWRLVTRCN